MPDILSHLWDWLVVFFWAFVFISYLMVLFSIIADLARDSKLNGWAKAVWIVFLVWVPFLTALIYLIARGSGMGTRQAAVQKEAKSATDSYIREVAGTSAAEQIAQAKQLLDAGTITAAEFETLKAHALS